MGTASFISVVMCLHFVAQFPQPSESSPMSRSGSIKCGEPSNPELRNRIGRVLSGADARPEEFPWMVSIKSMKGSDPSGDHLCGGFVINSRHIVSAAHCFRRKYSKHLDYKEDGSVNPRSVKVFLGQSDLGSSENAKLASIEYLAIHPDFENGGHLRHDIAILRTEEEMVWATSLSPICLPELEIEDYTDSISNATVAGWGSTHCPKANMSKKLQKATLPLWKNAACAQAYEEARYENDFTRDGFVCAGDFKKDALEGDSGSPLMMLQDNKWTAIGIVSFGRHLCDHRVPGVYTKVASYLNWIEAEIK